MIIPIMVWAARQRIVNIQNTRDGEGTVQKKDRRLSSSKEGRVIEWSKKKRPRWNGQKNQKRKEKRA